MVSPCSTPPILLMVVNDPDFFLSHRLPVALRAQKEGYEVHIATASGEAVAQIQQHGLKHHAVRINRSGSNPFYELLSILSLFRLFKRVRPDAVHLVTIKPVLYGGIAAKMAGVPAVIAAISGLGSVFVSDPGNGGGTRRIVQALYRFALRHDHLRVIFQNEQDQSTVLSMGAVRNDQCYLIRGSGADLSLYARTQEPDGTPTVVMAARLLLDKGVKGFVDAARVLKDRNVAIRIQLVGNPDPQNPRSITDDDLQEWEREGVVELLGFRDDINAVFSNSHIVTLPSHYGEGLPKVLIEAAACGRAVITTDHPGCRDAVIPDETGILVPIKDSEALANAIQYLVENPEVRKSMGAKGRQLAEECFDVNKVVEAHMDIYRSLLEKVEAKES